MLRKTIKKKLSSILAGTVALSGMFVIPPQKVWAETTTLIATADAYIQSGTNANKNYGAAGTLLSKQSIQYANNKRLSYVKFDFNSVSDISSAKFKFTTEGTASNDILHIYGISNDTWTEGTGGSSGGTANGAITWNNAPNNNINGYGLTGDGITEIGTVTNSSIYNYEIDVTSFIQAQSDKIATFVILSDTVNETVTDTITSRTGTVTANRPSLIFNDSMSIQSTVKVTTPYSATLDWTAVNSATSYDIYRKNSTESVFTKIGTTATNTYIDNAVSIAALYSYYIVAFTPSGQSVSSCKEVAMIDTNVQVPNAPASLTAAREATSVTLTWPKADNALFYYIYQKSSADSTFKIIASMNQDELSTESYKIDGLQENLNYDFQVVAVNSGGMSTPITASAPTTMPQIPTALQTEKVGWSVVDLVATADSSATNCYVYRSDSQDGTYSKIGTTTKATTNFRFEDTTVAASTDYYYSFSAYNDAGESSMTTPIKVSTKAAPAIPQAPKELDFTSLTKGTSSYTVRLDWTYAYGATSYNVYRSESATSGFAKIGTSTSGYYNDTITGAVENNVYYYKVIAINVSGESPESEVRAAKITSNFRMIPKAVTATSTPTAVTLNWTAVTGADSYNIYRTLMGDSNYTKIGSSITNSYVDSTGISGNSYEYRITSVDNINGESLKTYAFSLKWTAVEGATDYDIYRKSKNSDDKNYAKIGTSTSNIYLDETAVAGKLYDYKVTNAADTTKTAIVTLGGEEYLPTGSFIDETETRIQATTKELSYSYEGEALKLNWQAVDGATSYNIYRSSFEDSKYHFIGNSNTNNFTVSDNNKGGTYYYRVTALNAAGETDKSEAMTVLPKTTLKRQMEKIDRGINAVKASNGVLVSWRYLGIDSPDIAFNVYRDNVKINTAPITTSTNYLDAAGTTSSEYYVTSIINGQEVETSKTVTPWENNYKDIPIQKPADRMRKDGTVYSYFANDASVGDLDGDGDYEIVLKWDPRYAKDNSQEGYTGNTYIDAYEMDGTFMWRINLGDNVRAGAHYTDVMVYDFDGDGKAEVTLRTADGTIDGLGNIIGDDKADYRNSSGYVIDGPEYHTVFEGATGKALASEPYEPQRGVVADWGDNYGNRVDRFIAGIAYLDGKTPSVVMQRGYYTRLAIAAYGWDGSKITKQWLFDSSNDEMDPNGIGYRGYEGQGNHQISIADVDNDGMDEVITGAAVIDNDGKALYTTRLGHGDAMHVGDLDPTNPGLEIFQVQEDPKAAYGMDIRNAGTGEILFGVNSGIDNGRGLSADIDPRYLGEELWSLDNTGLYTVNGEKILSYDSTKDFPTINHAIWWDGDLQRELLDHNWVDYTDPPTPAPGRIDKWDYNTNTLVNLLTADGTSSNNGTKGNPALQADLFGDWREEAIWRLGDSSALRIFTTTDVTDNRIYTLMHDPIYRLGVAWQNTGYNQPPHTSFYLGTEMETPKQPNITTKSGGEEVVNPEIVVKRVLPQSGYFNLGDSAKVRISVTNNSTESKNVALIVGLFDDNNHMVLYGASQFSIERLKQTELEVMMNIPSSGSYTVKYFVWDSLDGQTIIAEPGVIPVN